MTDLVVLGAGPAGLGAAAKAAGRGLSVVVLEREDRVGGAAGSFEFEGIRVDRGSHRLHPSVAPEILADLRATLGDDLQRRTRNGRIRLMGRWLRFPLGPADVLRQMPRAFIVGAARDAIVAPLRRPRADTFEEVLRAGLGPTVCDRFYFPYARKIWGVGPDELAGEQARRRVAADSAMKMVTRVLRGSGSGGERGSSFFWYPKRGYGQLSEALAATASAHGAEIRLGETARSVRRVDDGVEVGTENGTIAGARLFSTIPVTTLARLLDPPSDVAAAAASLRFRSMLLVYLALERDRYTPFDAHYLPEPFTPVTRLSEPKNYRDGDDPADRTVLCAELPCDRTDALWSAPDEELAEGVAAGLRAAGLAPVAPFAVHVERMPFAYPIYDLTYAAHLDVVDSWLGRQDRILTFGRQGLFAHDNAHHALAMAYEAVACLRADGTFDAPRWRRAREGFARHVVED